MLLDTFWAKSFTEGLTFTSCCLPDGKFFIRVILVDSVSKISTSRMKLQFMIHDFLLQFAGRVSDSTSRKIRRHSLSRAPHLTTTKTTKINNLQKVLWIVIYRVKPVNRPQMTKKTKESENKLIREKFQKRNRLNGISSMYSFWLSSEEVIFNYKL
jgi:hypothetical protein